MARPPKTTEVTEEEVGKYEPVPVKREKELIIALLRTGKMNMFERSTRWLADRIEAGDHLK